MKMLAFDENIAHAVSGTEEGHFSIYKLMWWVNIH